MQTCGWIEGRMKSLNDNEVGCWDTRHLRELVLLFFYLILQNDSTKIEWFLLEPDYQGDALGQYLFKDIFLDREINVYLSTVYVLMQISL